MTPETDFMRRPIRQTGFSLLELVVVIIIISFLLAFAFERLMKLQVQAERAAMEQIIGHLQSALALTISEHIAKGRIHELKKYAGTNPMDLLADTPVNYLGTFPETPKTVEKASWWYETGSRTLIYVVGNREYFQTDGPKKGLVKLKILPVYDDSNRNGRFDSRETLRGLKISPVYRYRWLNEPIDPEDYTARPFPD